MWYGKLIEFYSTMGGLPDFFSNKFLYKRSDNVLDTLSWDINPIVDVFIDCNRCRSQWDMKIIEFEFEVSKK